MFSMSLESSEFAFNGYIVFHQMDVPYLSVPSRWMYMPFVLIVDFAKKW